jgi:AAA domain, putative AbiEii toxin, Type IV TA system/AAA ATPase domain
MIRSVKITGYRALDNFAMTNLGRINLLVGKNNTGKTSVLESLYLLATTGDPSAIWRVLSRRGEQISDAPAAGRPFQLEVEPCHLFHGHGIRLGTRATIETFNGSPDRSLEFEITESNQEANPALYAQIQPQLEGGVGPRFTVSISGNPTPLAPLIPLSVRGGLRQDVLQLLVNMNANSPRTPDTSKHQYVTTESLSIGEVQAAYNLISLSPRESQVIRALQFIEPRIERIAPAAGVFFAGAGWPTRGGLKAKLAGLDEPVPIGSLGEGTWRMLALAISLASAKNSVFLVDEIDTGLHHTVMTSMWKFVAEVAKEFNVQVFATTHSGDCLRSLAAVCHEDVRVGSEVTIQRLESTSARTIAYDEAEIVALARNKIEVR